MGIEKKSKKINFELSIFVYLRRRACASCISCTCSLINVKVVLCLQFLTCLLFKVLLCQNYKFRNIIKIISFFLRFWFRNVFPCFGFIIAQDYDVRIVRAEYSGNFRQFSRRFTPIHRRHRLQKLIYPETACILPVFGFCCGMTKRRIGPKVTEHTFRLPGLPVRELLQYCIYLIGITIMMCTAQKFITHIYM